MSPGVQGQSGQNGKTMKPCLPHNGRIGGEGNNTDSLLAHGYKHAHVLQICQMFVTKTESIRSFSPKMHVRKSFSPVHGNCPRLCLTPHLHCPSTACGLFHRLLFSLPFSSSCWLTGIFSRTVVLYALRTAAACLN